MWTMFHFGTPHFRARNMQNSIQLFQDRSSGLPKIYFEVNTTCARSSDFNLRIEVDEPKICQLLEKFVLIASPSCSSGNLYRQCKEQNGGERSSRCNFRCKCTSTPCHGALVMHDLMGMESVNVKEIRITASY